MKNYKENSLEKQMEVLAKLRIVWDLIAQLI